MMVKTAQLRCGEIYDSLFCEGMVCSSTRGIWSFRPTRNLLNEAELVEEFHQIAELNKLKFIYFHGSGYSILDTQAKFLKADVIVGAHGANMANQIFSGFDPSITVIEIVGTNHFTKYENYQSYWYDAWSSFHYFLIGMRKKQVELMDVQKVFKFAGFTSQSMNDMSTK